MRDLGNQVTRDTLRAIRDNLPNISGNQATYDYISALLLKKIIQPVPYTYIVAFAVDGAANFLAAGANSLSNMQIQADADFLILNQTYDSNTQNGVRYDGVVSAAPPAINIVLTDTGAGFNMMDQSIPVPSIFGNGCFPYILPEPKLMPAKSTLQVQVFNLDTVNGYNLRLMFNGVKLYAYN